MRYDAIFTRQNVTIRMRLEGSYEGCYAEATRIAKQLGWYFSGILEELP